jgi:fructokinase
MLRSHVVKISTDDAEYMAPGVDPLDYAGQLVDRGVAVVLVTAGGDGAWAVTRSARTLVPVQPTSVVDTIGAGDSFGGAFLAWWLDREHGVAGLDSHDLVVAAVEAAQEVAAFTCSQAGAEPPRRHQLTARWTTRSTAR